MDLGERSLTYSIITKILRIKIFGITLNRVKKIIKTA